MTGSIWHIAAAGAFLLITHFGLSSTPLRAGMVKLLGEIGYQAVYSLIALFAIVWLAMAFNDAPYGTQLWSLYPVGHYAAVVIMPIALLLVVGGYAQPNPTAIGLEELAGSEPVGITRITRHPVMWGITLWAVAHMLANGNSAALLLFASLGLLALIGTVLIDIKKSRQRGVAYQVLKERSSNIPFAAIVAGRQSLAKAVQEMGWWRIALVVIAYGALLHLHSWLFGVSAYPA